MAKASRRPILAGLLGMCITLAAGCAHADTSPIGNWFTEDEGGVVQVRPCGTDVLCGYIEGLRDVQPDGSPPRNFAGEPQCHLLLLKDLRFHKEDGRWHGSVTNPEDGRVYKAEVWVPADGRFRLHGYLAVPLLGSTQIWRPFAGKIDKDCHF
jgi:uncharacterized protein (DUF2147 family)